MMLATFQFEFVTDNDLAVSIIDLRYSRPKGRTEHSVQYIRPEAGAQIMDEELSDLLTLGLAL